MSVKAGTRFFLLTLSGLFFWCHAAFSSEFVTLGEAKLIQGKLIQAQDYLLRALEEDPSDSRALGSLGIVYFHRAMYREAEEKLLSSMARMPVHQWVRCWNNVYLGKIGIINGALENAAGRFREASEAQATANCRRESERYLAYIDVLQFAGKRLTKKLETGCCVIHYADDVVAHENTEAAAGRIQGYFEKIKRRLNISFENGLIHVYLYPPAYQYRLWAARDLLAGRLMEHEIRVFYRHDVDDGHLEHEMVHVMTGPELEGCTPIPLLNEGLAEYVVGDLWGLSLNAWVKGFLQCGCFVPITRLAESSTFWATNPALSYPEAGAFVKFLVDSHGTGRLFEVAAGALSWETAYGLSLAELEGRWLAHLETLSVGPVDKDLLDYRLRIGDRYGAAGFSSEGLPWAGVTYEVTAEGLIIRDVATNGPARKAGLLAGDRITKIDGVAVTDADSWLPAAMVHQKEIGDSVFLVVERGSVEKSFRITLESECYE